jgi:putative acetyltransferase
MKIRPETPQDFPFLYNFVKDAFKTAKISNGDEQNFVDKLRTIEGYIPELALVAEENSKIIGHIMLISQDFCHIRN